MSNWCNNRLIITGQSVFVDEVQKWVNGHVVPDYRHAILQSCRLFLAGCAGILKPATVKPGIYVPYPGLLAHPGVASPQNLAFEQWIGLLKADVSLTTENIRLIERLYRQSGIDAVKWENIPAMAQARIADVLTRQYADWFGIVGVSPVIDAGNCWERLGMMPEYTAPCDMLMLIPTRLATELNGSGDLLRDVPTTPGLYGRQYGVEWPCGHNVGCVRDGINTLTVHFDSPWYPPEGEVIGVLSEQFSCQVEHAWFMPDAERSGYDCYDRGEHVDGGRIEPEDEVVYLTYADKDSVPLSSNATAS
ncbi:MULTISPECIES: DUF1281 domain-containing protein [Enterobacteriaceae]|uniref:DUF1281 domain-containing protein n=1 Tax=Enterobacteriaceae TaxID=543 RepID=UPI0008634DC6|nr:DUF1281 domain-containing protein [Klebsiella sp. LTGPAF-6F]AOV10051.1 hypothetical protein BJF97_02995 [Klebsiella sp. LTGPAF-6F]